MKHFTFLVIFFFAFTAILFADKKYFIIKNNMFSLTPGISFSNYAISFSPKIGWAVRIKESNFYINNDFHYFRKKEDVNQYNDVLRHSYLYTDIFGMYSLQEAMDMNRIDIQAGLGIGFGYEFLTSKNENIAIQKPNHNGAFFKSAGKIKIILLLNSRIYLFLENATSYFISNINKWDNQQTLGISINF